MSVGFKCLGYKGFYEANYNCFLLSYMPFGRVNGRSKDGKELIQCPTPGADILKSLTQVL